MAASPVASFAKPADPTATLEAWRVATLKRDIVALEEILHEHLLFGHSNGRLESKEEFIRGVQNRNPIYESIELGTQTLVGSDSTALLRGDMTVVNVREGSRNTWKINVHHVFVLEKRQWRMIGRQATRLGN
jgi:hypothetical protein